MMQDKCTYKYFESFKDNYICVCVCFLYTYTYKLREGTSIFERKLPNAQQYLRQKPRVLWRWPAPTRASGTWTRARGTEGNLLSESSLAGTHLLHHSPTPQGLARPVQTLPHLLPDTEPPGNLEYEEKAE